jgi:hypothetical protein
VRLEPEQRQQRVRLVARRAVAAHRVRQAQRVGQETAARAAMLADHHVVEHAHAAEQRQVLERAADADLGDAMARHRQQRPAVEHDRAALAVVQAADAVEQRGLAGAVRPDQPDDAPGRDVERHAVERDDAAEAYPDLLHSQQCLAGHDCLPPQTAGQCTS